MKILSPETVFYSSRAKKTNMPICVQYELHGYKTQHDHKTDWSLYKVTVLYLLSLKIYKFIFSFIYLPSLKEIKMTK